MAPKRHRAFSVKAFLESGGVARRVVEFRRLEVVFAQGDQASDVMYIQRGGIKLSVASQTGKEAVVAVLGPGDFFGEGCLAGQRRRIGSATAITPSTLVIVRKREMLRKLHQRHELSDHFITCMLGKNIRIEEDFIDQLFNSTEKRLARTLLRLARYGQQDSPRRVLPMISSDTLAAKIGTTRARVKFFMNKFRKLGFVADNGGLQINNSLLSVVLHD
jgi:CRP/FNR family transcriptional regulator, cyclic AMP receptor protein